MQITALSFPPVSKSRFAAVLLSLFMVIQFCQVSLAGDEAQDEPADLDTRIPRYHLDYFVNDDYSSYVLTDTQLELLNEDAVKNNKSIRLSYSTSIEELDIIEAYTLKPDGTKLSVPENNYQTRTNKGHKAGAPVFSDRTSVTVVYPDVEVKDILAIKFRTTQKEPMFAGHFSAQNYFYRHAAFDDVLIRLNLPEAMPFEYQVREMTESTQTTDGRKIVELRHSNPAPVKNHRHDFTVWSSESQPGFALSTFKDYQQVAEAYGARALPKALPTERVIALAKEIIGRTTDDRQKARLLYEWVATNITYAGNCIGVGAVVPHDLSFTLDNRMGDCKDHATLLQSLLTAEGIQSTQALINSGAEFYLPTIPMVSSVNHVINYLPAFKQFIDATSSTTPFNMLPASVQGKPVLLVEDYQPGLRTPTVGYGINEQRLENWLDIQPDGSVKGKGVLNTKGEFAVGLRTGWRHASPQEEKKWIEDTFSNRGHKGIGSMIKDDPEPLEDSYNYSIEFEKNAFLEGSGAGGFYIGPVFSTAAAIGTFLYIYDEPFTADEVVCSSGRSEEIYHFSFPDNIKLLATPDDFSVDESYIHYTASYKTEGNKLEVTRVLEDRSPTNLCSAELLNKQQVVLLKILDNLNSQVVYKR